MSACGREKEKKTESRPSFSGTPLIRKRAEPEFLKPTVAVINVAKDRLGFYFIFLVSLFLLSLEKKKNPLRAVPVILQELILLLLLRGLGAGGGVLTFGPASVSDKDDPVISQRGINEDKTTQSAISGCPCAENYSVL